MSDIYMTQLQAQREAEKIWDKDKTKSIGVFYSRPSFYWFVGPLHFGDIPNIDTCTTYTPEDGWDFHPQNGDTNASSICN